MLSKTCIAATLAIACSALAADEQRPEWPMARGNPGLTGRSPDASVKPPLRRRWVYQTPACFFKTEPCVAAGKVFLCTYEGFIMALGADSGRPAWMRLDLAEGNHYSNSFVTLCCDGTRLFFARNEGVYALNAATGKTLWTHAFNGVKPVYPLAPMMVFAEGKLFFTRLDERGVFAVALKPKDGTEVWATRLGEAGWNLRRELCYADGMVYASASIDRDGPAAGSGKWAAHEGRVVALKAADGSLVWRRDDLPGGGAGHGKLLTCVSDGRIVCCSAPYRRQAQVLDAKTGKTLWTTRKGVHASWFVIPGDLVLAGCTGIGAGFACYDGKTGEYLGRSRTRGGASNCSLAAVSGGYAFTNMGTPGVPSTVPAIYRYPVSSLGAVNLETRELDWSYRLEGNACASPAIAYGRVYVCGAGGWVYCFEPVAEAPPPPLPPDVDPARLRETQKEKMGNPQGPGRGATFRGQDKPRGGDSWPMYGGCPQRCGLELEISLPLEPAWNFDTGGEVHSSAAIDGGTAYVGSDSGRLFALDLKSGAKRWEFAAGGPVHCSPAVGRGLVVFGSDDGKLYALDAKSGEKKWAFQTGDLVRAAPAIVADKVVFGSWDRCVYALNLADGKRLWRYATGHVINAAPAVYNGRVFAGSGDWLLYALALESGKPDWSRILVGAARGVAVYRDMVALLYGGRDAAMAYLCPENGAPAMKQVGGGWRCRAAFGAPAFSGDWMFFGRWYGGGMGIVNLKEEKAHSSRRQSGASGCLEAPLCTKDLMIIATIMGTVEAHSIYDGKEPARKLWEWKTPSGKMFHASPVAAGGHIVVGNDDGFVYAFRHAGR